MDTIRQTKLIVDVDCVKHNINAIQNHIGDSVGIMPVIKARAYGTGIGAIPDLFENLGIKILAVAVVDEGIALRERGYTGEIFILNQPLVDEIDMILQYNLTISICECGFIKDLNEAAGKNDALAPVHLEIDTGMGRTGIKTGELQYYIELLKSMKNIKVEGVFTHFSSSDSDIGYTKKQIERFDKVISEMSTYFSLKYIHACNSGGILNCREAHYNLVRPGIALYGHFPSGELKGKIELLPATRLKTKISYIHDVKEGQSVSYNRSYIADKDTKVAVIPIGYADGIMRSYDGKVVINEELARVIGVINMDSFMVDITGMEDVDVGADVYIWDNSNVTLEDVAENCDTISHEILSRLSPRVVKEFVEKS
ncbi:MAG: alanine racemase [Oscillospiraceae bacterium]|nr:alanine racemase [Oscillospiraceae bacterium]